MAQQEIGQVEAAEGGLAELGEQRVAGEEAIAMGAGEALDPFALQQGVQPAARAAIGIGDKDVFETGGAGLGNMGGHTRG